MQQFRMDDLRCVEHAPTSPLALRNKFEQLILSSTHAKAKVDAVNPETGEYRIVLHGTLDREETRSGGEWS